MMSAEPMLLVLRTALFTSLAILVLLAARSLLHRRFGAALAYQAWLIVPVVALASLLPARSAPQVLSVQVLRPVQALAADAAPIASPGQADVLLLAWACGAAASALWFILGHHAFLRKAGRLTRSGAVHVSEAGAGPASVGLLKPRIVVPHDFAQRYSPLEQALVIAHEQVHVARRDAIANLIVALFQCAFWFNPLVHLGARFLRRDQELACDAAVMRRHPRRRRAYAEALLKSHTGALAAAGIHCHWQNQHPTKERIMRLQQTPPGTIRRLAGRCTLALLAAGAFGATLGVRAEQPPAKPQYSVALAIASGSEPDVTLKLTAESFVQDSTRQGLPRVVTAAGEKFSVSSGEWRLDMVVNPGDTPDKVWLTGKLFKGAVLVTAPTLLARVGEPATVRVGEGEQSFGMAMTVSPQP
jgi:beta-lactamase regulating signal transducer with metallopeptidase domain